MKEVLIYLKYFSINFKIKFSCTFFITIMNLGEKQVQSLKEQNNRYHLEEMMMKLKMEQMMKLTKNECKKIYSLEQQRNELTQVDMSVDNQQ